MRARFIGYRRTVIVTQENAALLPAAFAFRTLRPPYQIRSDSVTPTPLFEGTKANGRIFTTKAGHLHMCASNKKNETR